MLGYRYSVVGKRRVRTARRATACTGRREARLHNPAYSPAGREAMLSGAPEADVSHKLSARLILLFLLQVTAQITHHYC